MGSICFRHNESGRGCFTLWNSQLVLIEQWTLICQKIEENFKSIWPKSLFGTLTQILMQWWWSFWRESSWTDPLPLRNTVQAAIRLKQQFLYCFHVNLIMSFQTAFVRYSSIWISSCHVPFVFLWPWISCMTTRGQASTQEMMSLRPWTVWYFICVCAHSWHFFKQFLQNHQHKKLCLTCHSFKVTLFIEVYAETTLILIMLKTNPEPWVLNVNTNSNLKFEASVVL